MIIEYNGKKYEVKDAGYTYPCVLCDAVEPCNHIDNTLELPCIDIGYTEYLKEVKE